MDRRKFLQSLVLIPLASYIKLEATPQQKQVSDLERGRSERELIETVPIAGFQFYQGDNLWRQLNLNDRLMLKRETENEYDKNAIIIQWKDEQLGYIPRLENQTIALLMDEGVKLDAKIIKLSKSKNPWNRVEVALYQII